MDFAGVVPDDTPFRNMSDHPPPGIGPYRITTSVPSREFVLERSDRFAIPGIPRGHLARITTRIVRSPEREATMVIRGDLDYMLEPPPTDLLPQIRTKYKDRYEEHVTDSTYYFFMNVRLPPFDRRPVRQAVNYAIDSGALARLFGGRLAPACNFLPPGVPGHRTLQRCPYSDPDGPGELDKARELVEQAGAAGEPVTVWTHTDGVAQPVGEYLEDVLDEIGLDAELEAVDGAVFVQIVGNPRTRAQIGFANWFPDFPHPANVLYAVDGDTIQSANNQNFGNIDDPELNRLIDDVNRLPAEEAAAPAARADRRLVEEAFVAPYGSERLSTFFSERMDFEHCSRFHPVYHNDYSSFCLR
jgi:peptide/nickel transport system substrate-binding protein